MASPSSTRSIQWTVTIALAAAFCAIWWPQLSVAPITHDEADALLHAQLGARDLWQLTAESGRWKLAYWIAISPLAHLETAVTSIRLVSLAAGAIVVVSMSRVAGWLWGSAGAIAAGGFLLIHPLLVPASLQGTPVSLSLAMVALASWLLVGSLEQYESPGGFTALVYLVTMAGAVALNIFLLPAVIAHIIYAITMRPSTNGYARILPGWLASAGVAVWLWMSTTDHHGISDQPTTDPGVVINAVNQTSITGSDGLTIVVAASAVLIVLAMFSTKGDAFFDTGLGLSLGLICAPPIIWMVLNLTWEGLSIDHAMDACLLGVALFVGCAAGQWRGQVSHPVIVLAMVIGLGAVGWLDYSTVRPSWRNDDGNPPLARDLQLHTNQGDVIAIDDDSAPGLAGAIASTMGDDRLWDQARDEISSGDGTVVMRIESLDPWQSAQASLNDAVGSSGGDLIWVSQTDSSPHLDGCTAQGVDHYAGTSVTTYQCA